jgi:hypothetical protein
MALAAIAVRPEWYTDALPLDANIKETMEQLSGKWIVECPELAGLSSARLENLKALAPVSSTGRDRHSLSLRLTIPGNRS